MNEELLKKFLEDFYSQIRQNKILGPVFENSVSNWDSHLGKTLIFWRHHLLEPGVYKGNLLKVHQKLDTELNEKLFREWLTLFESAAGKHFKNSELKKICLKARMIGGTLFGRIHETQLEVPGFPPSDLF